MPGPPVAVHPAARTELRDAYGWHFERSPTAALAFLEEIDRAIEAISESPNRWPPSLEVRAGLFFVDFRFQLCTVIRGLAFLS